MAKRKNYGLIKKFYGDDENICFHFSTRKGKYAENALPQFTGDGEDYLVVHSSFRPVVEWFNEGKLEKYDCGLWSLVDTRRLIIDKDLIYYRKKVDTWLYTISFTSSYIKCSTYSELELIIKELKPGQEIKIIKKTT